jgi:hypothetical protein
VPDEIRPMGSSAGLPKRFDEAMARGFVAHASVEAVCPGAAFVGGQHDVSCPSLPGPIFRSRDQSPTDALAAVLRSDDKGHDARTGVVVFAEVLEVRKGSEHLEDDPSRWGARVDRLGPRYGIPGPLSRHPRRCVIWPMHACRKASIIEEKVVHTELRKGNSAARPGRKVTGLSS